MCLAPDDEVVHTLAPDRSDQPFRKAILPRRRGCNRLVPDAHGTQSACNAVAIDAIPITQQIFRRLVPGKCLSYLACDPCRRWVCGDVDPDEVPAVQPNNNEGIEQAEPDGWDNEQVHRRYIWRMITQKGTPSLAWRPTSPNHVFRDAGLCDFKSELEQFAVDTRCAPKRVLDAHPPDQHAQIRVDLRAPSPSTRLPPPVAAKTNTMPAHQRLRLNDRRSIQDRREPSIRLDEEPAIAIRQPDLATQVAPQYDQLMAKHHILSFKPHPRLKWRGRERKE